MFSYSRKLIFSCNAFIADAIALEVHGSRVQSREMLTADILPAGVGDLIGDYLDVLSMASGELPPISNSSSYSVFILRA